MSSRTKRRARQTGREPARAQRHAPVALPRISNWIVAAFVAIVALAYAPAIKAPFVLDDVQSIAENASIHSIATSFAVPPNLAVTGRPIANATLALNYVVNAALRVDQRHNPDGPNQTIGYHVLNIVFHLCAGALLFGFLRRAMRERVIPDDWRAIADPFSGIVTALWLLHPLQSEVVNYVVQRTESLASLFYIATLYASQRAWEERTSRMRWYAAAVVACALGMLSKEIVISAPLAVMLYDRAFRLPSWRALARPADGRGLLYAALWIVAIGTFVFVSAGGRGEASGLSLGMTWPAYLYTQCWAIAHYFRLVVWPTPLAIDYGFNTIHGARGIPGFVLLSLFGALTIAAWIRAERYGWFAFVGSMFFMVLAPSSSFVPQALEVAAERRTYLVLAGVLVIAVAGLEWLRRRFAPTIEFRRLIIALGVTATALAVGTALRSSVYNSPVALWRSAVQAVPDNSRARAQLGWAFFNLPTPMLDSAESEFKLVMAQDSTCRAGCLEYATLLSNEGRYAEAVPLLDRRLAYEGANILAARLAALDLMHLGEFSRAIPYLEHVVTQAPRESHIIVLGVAYLSAGRKDDAIAMFRYLGTLDSGNDQLRILSARLEDGAANHPEALADLQQFAYYQARGWM